MKTCIVDKNTQGGYYERGRKFGPAKWSTILQTYRTEVELNGKCTIRRLATLAQIGRNSAAKAVKYHDLGFIPSLSKTTRKGVGSLKGLKMKHHAFIFSLYLSNPALPNYGYCEEMLKKFGISLSPTFITRWFKSIGPFKGTFRKTSKFPPAKYSRNNLRLLKRYLAFASLYHPSRFVFADEKPMKEIDIFGLVRRNVMDGTIPRHKMNANSKNRWNILAAVTVKKDVQSCVEYIIIDECTDASVFVHFVGILIKKRVLQRGDIFVVDNCTVHMKGDNGDLQDQLLRDLGVLMVPLPPYWCELNPTELVFQTLLARLNAERRRYNATSNDTFFLDIDGEMGAFSHRDVKKMYIKCGYKE